MLKSKCSNILQSVLFKVNWPFADYSNSGSIIGFEKGVWSFMLYVTATPISAQNDGKRPKPNRVTEI